MLFIWIGQNIDYDIDNYYSLDYVDVDQKEYFKMVKQYIHVILVYLEIKEFI